MNLSEKHLILVFCLLFAISSLFLFWKNETELDPNYQKNWWTLSFAEPENIESLNFTIENHSDTKAFRYQLLIGKQIGPEQTIEVPKGERKTVMVETKATDGLRTSVRVFTDEEKKEIYR